MDVAGHVQKITDEEDILADGGHAHVKDHILIETCRPGR